MPKTSRGGGNSLKFRVKSEEVRVGGSSSSWRFGKRELGRGKRNFSLFNLHCSLSVLLAGVIAIAASGAWADTNQKFLFVGQNSALSDWAIGSSWIYSNGGDGSAGNWKSTSGKPDDYNYDVYFRSPMNAKNGNTYSYRSDWDHVVTFSGAHRVGKDSRYPVHLDLGSTAENPIVFDATQDNYGLTCSTMYIAESADGFLVLRRGTYETTSWWFVGNVDGKAPEGRMVVGDGVSVRTGGNLSLNDGNITVNGGKVYVGIDLNIAYRGSGEFVLNGGDVDVARKILFGGYYASDPAVLRLNGGTLTAPTIAWHNGNTVPSIVFDGGTLKARANGILIKPTSDISNVSSKLYVTVGEGGGTVDNNGFKVSVDADIGGTGGMTFKGGGTTTLNNEATYSGRTAVVPGTTLVVYRNDQKNNILDKGLVVAGIPNEGDEIFIVTRGPEYTISEEQLAKVTCPLAPTTTFELGEGNTNIVVKTVGPTLDNYWTGAANDGNLSNAANWNGEVPTSGNAVIFCATNSTLTKGDVFAPQSITFLGGSAAVTINGEFSGITQIANNSSSKVEFKDAVAFSGNVDVVQNSGVVKFTGGVTGEKLAHKTDIHGTYTFSQTEDLTEIANTTVKSDGVYNLPKATFFKHNGDFHVEAGGKAVVMNAKISSNYACKLLGVLDGVFVVTKQFMVTGNNTHYMCNSGAGTFIVNELRPIQNGKIVPGAKTIMGPDGIIRGAGYVRVQNNGSHEFGSYADWTMYHNSKGTNTATESPVFYKHSSTTWSYLTFDTTDYYDNTIGRTITCEAPISAADEASAAKFRVTVKGKGKFVFANTSNGNIFSGGLIVQDSATVEVKANAKPGKGAITLGAGTTLALTAESREFTPLANTLNLPTEGTATLRIDGKRLRSGEHVIAQSVTGASENIKLDEKECEAVGGRKYTLSVEDDKGLVLNIVSDGTMIIVR